MRQYATFPLFHFKNSEIRDLHFTIWKPLEIQKCSTSRWNLNKGLCHQIMFLYLWTNSLKIFSYPKHCRHIEYTITTQYGSSKFYFIIFESFHKSIPHLNMDTFTIAAKVESYYIFSNSLLTTSSYVDMDLWLRQEQTSTGILDLFWILHILWNYYIMRKLWFDFIQYR